MEKYYLFFRRLANKTKMDIVCLLRKKEISVNEVVKKSGIEQSKVSHALSQLRCCNIVKVKQDGKKRIYSLNKNTIIPILNIIDRHEKEYCGGNCPLLNKAKSKD